MPMARSSKPVNEVHLADLVQMGYDSAQARKALLATAGGVEQAVEWLSSGGTAGAAARPATGEALPFPPPIPPARHSCISR